jgi:hypothetical protein
MNDYWIDFGRYFSPCRTCGCIMEDHGFTISCGDFLPKDNLEYLEELDERRRDHK